jgi:hypothetical protein
MVVFYFLNIKLLMISIKNSESLVTSLEERIRGFQWQAQQKNTLGNHFFLIADHFLTHASKIRSIEDIWSDPKIKEFALAASSLSKKSLTHIDQDNQKIIVSEIVNIEKLNDAKYLLELSRRYLLTCGDSLGGSMRNIVGQTAQKKFANLIDKKLNSKGYKSSISANGNGKIVEIIWSNLNGERKILFDKKVDFIGKNIDFIVLCKDYNKESFDNYIACGELKGGIDPAGADEHWKTARSALNRVKEQFVKNNYQCPPLFFIAAAIEISMAAEIFSCLNNRELKAAANLTNLAQVDELLDILIDL